MCRGFQARRAVTLFLLLVVTACTASLLRAEPLPRGPLNLQLPVAYTAPPPVSGQQSPFYPPARTNSFAGVETRKVRPLGYRQVKIDSSMRIRGWEVKENLYLGQTRVGDDWGVGMMLIRGDFAYGLNDEGIGMTIKKKNAVYRINSHEISLEIDF